MMHLQPTLDNLQPGQKSTFPGVHSADVKERSIYVQMPRRFIKYMLGHFSLV